MTVAAGTLLGPYEILALLGAGGMGEVYRARDERLKREVAVKVLPPSFSSDSHRLKRFEQEAQAAGGLNHPNITAVYDIGSHEGAPYIVSELLEGETLRARLSRGALPSRKAVELATQITNGLAAAHEKGIVHRDLKPGNLFMTKDGGVKILDFGLAKLTHPEEQSGSPTDERTATAVSGVGVVLGTLGYMSPEQARGLPADRRSDIFSFGAVLYEMLVGLQAFRGVSRVEILSRILEEDPPELYKIDPRIPPGLMRIVGRCLEKEPRDRFESIKDVGFALNANARSSEDSGAVSGSLLEVSLSRRRVGRWALAVALAAIVGAAYWLGRRVEHARTSEPSFRQLTFRGAGIGTARFAPDGQTIVLSSQTEGRPPELLSLRLDSPNSPETRPLGLPPAHILSIARSGNMAILLLRPFALFPRIGHIGLEQAVHRDRSLLEGTLAVAQLGGGAPRELLEDVLFADWAPNGTDLAVVHRVGNRNRLEFPIGKAIYDSEVELLNHPRISSRQPRVAFKDWGALFADDRSGVVRELRDVAGSEIAWSDATGEIWYTDVLAGVTNLRAITPEGRGRLVAALPGDFILYDITPDGRALLGRNVESTEILGSFPGEPRERNLSHFDSSVATDLSSDGEKLLFVDVSLVRGTGNIYLRKTDGAPPKRLGDGGASAVSSDGRFVLTEDHDGHVLLPTGSGPIRKLASTGVATTYVEYRRSGFFPDGKEIFFCGRESGKRQRVWVQQLEGSKPRAVTPENTSRPVLLGDGRFICARGPDFEWYLYPVDAGEPRKVVGILPGEEPFRSTPDGLLYVRGADELRPGESLMTTRVYRLDPSTGHRELWKEIPPKDPRTGGVISTIRFSADGKTCVWTHMRYSTELVLVEGLK